MVAVVEIQPPALPGAGWSYEFAGGTVESLPEFPRGAQQQTLESLPEFPVQRHVQQESFPELPGWSYQQETQEELPGWSYQQETQESLPDYDDSVPDGRGPTPTPYGLLAPCEVAGIADAAGAKPGGERTAPSRPSCGASPGSPACSLLQWAGQASRGVQRWDPSQYVLVEKLQDAETNQGVVELMQALQFGGMRVAVKRMPTTWVRHGPIEFNNQHPGSKEQPWNDLGIMKYLNGIGFPFACDLHGVYRDSLTTYVVSSFATEGDLFSWVDFSGCAGRDHEVRAKPIVIQVFFAVWWLHELGIAHRDLSLENILLTKQGEDHVVKIIDFGAATALRHCGEGECRGKRNYQAPEMHTGGYDAFAADSFALGVVLFATMAHDFPWTSTKAGACKHYSYAQRNGLRALLTARRARKEPSRRLIEVLSPTLVDTIEGLSQANPSLRLNLGEACRTGSGKSSFWSTPWAQEV